MLTYHSKEEVEKLKEDWKKDPCWDIATTEGFEAHHDELLQFRLDYEKEKEKKYQEKLLSIFTMKLDECVSLHNTTYIKVPGGWLVSVELTPEKINTVFVPFEPADLSADLSSTTRSSTTYST